MSEDSTDLMHGLGSGNLKPFEENLVIYRGNLEESKQQQILSQLQDPLKDSDYMDEPIEMGKDSNAFKDVEDEDEDLAIFNSKLKH